MGSAICSPRRGADAQSLDQQSQGPHLLPVNEMFSDHNHFIEVEIFGTNIQFHNPLHPKMS